MKLRFLAMLSMAATVSLFTSCGSGEDKTTETTTDSTTATTATETTPVSTISTTPIDYMVVIHKVKDFSKWKPSYEEHDSMRLANGIHSYSIGRGTVDSSQVIVIVKVDDMDKAKAFSKDPSLKAAMQKGGVTGAPKIMFSRVLLSDSAVVNTEARVLTQFTVKDYDAWKRSFDSTRALNTDNGLKVRAYGHDADDSHKVFIVSAVLDEAKAKAYFDSDEIKKRMAAGGVVGAPNRFMYQTVQRYK